MTRLVLISDTHLKDYVPLVPPGDVLVHAGDLTTFGDLSELKEAVAQLAALPHPHKVVIAGNHDFCFERLAEAARALIAPHAVYLEDSAHTHAGITFYGSPWQPFFHSWAFNLHRGPALAAKWAQIPDTVDVLITHGPPHGILDQVHDGDSVGCEDLTRAVERVRPALHVFGHIHEAYGQEERQWEDGSRTLFVNASTCSLRYLPVHPPIVVDAVRDGSARLVLSI